MSSPVIFTFFTFKTSKFYPICPTRLVKQGILPLAALDITLKYSPDAPSEGAMDGG